MAIYFSGSGSLVSDGIVSIAQGGTGANNKTSAINNLLPPQEGNENKILATNGSIIGWIDPPSSIPSQIGNSGKVLYTDGFNLYWAFPSGGGGGGGGSLPAGASGQLQFNNSGILSGTGRIVYNDFGDLTVGLGNTDIFKFLGSNAKDSLSAGTSIQLKAGDGFIATLGQTVPAAGNIYLTAGGSNGLNKPGFISFSTGRFPSEVFRINNNGSWSFDGTGENAGLPGQVLMSTGNADVPGISKPAWTELPRAGFTTRGIVKILKDNWPEYGNGLYFATNPLNSNPDDLYLLSTITGVVNSTEYAAYYGLDSNGNAIGPNYMDTILRDGNGRIYVNISKVTSLIIPKRTDSSGNALAGYFLSLDNAGNLLWRSDLYTLPIATNTTLGGVKVDNTTIKALPTGMISADINEMVPTQLGNEGKVLATDGSELYWTFSSIPIASPSVLGGVKVDNSSVRINSEGVISISVNNILPPQEGNDGKYLRSNGISAQWSTSSYELPIASTTILGGVKVDGLTTYISETGVLSARQPVYTYVDILPELPELTNNDTRVLGTNGESIDWIDTSGYVLPVASATNLGGIKPDNINTFVDNEGVLRVSGITISSEQPSGGLIINKDGETGTSETIGIGESTDANGTPVGIFTLGELPRGGATSSTFTFQGNLGVDINIKAGNSAYTRARAGNVNITGGQRGENPPGGGTVNITGGPGFASSVVTVNAGDVVISGGLGAEYSINEAYGGNIIFRTARTNVYKDILRIGFQGGWAFPSDEEGQYSAGGIGQPLLSRGGGNAPGWGTVPIAYGGTGATTGSQALLNLLPNIEGQDATILYTNGITVSWIPVYDVGDPVPLATVNRIGGVKPDGTSIVIDNDGVITATGQGFGTVTSVDLVSVDELIGIDNVIPSGDPLDPYLILDREPITSTGILGLSLRTIPIGRGGTGATTSSAAINNLLPIQTENTGLALITDGSDVYWGYQTKLPAVGNSGNLLYNKDDVLFGASRMSYNNTNTLTLGISHIGLPEDATFNIFGADGGVPGSGRSPSNLAIRPGRQSLANASSATMTIGGSPSVGENTAGGDVYIDGGTSVFQRGGGIILRTTSGPDTPLSDRLAIADGGAWAVNGDYGFSNEVLTSTGSDSPPVWRPLVADAFALTGESLSPEIRNSNLSTLGTLSSLKVTGSVGIGTEDPKSKLAVSLGDDKVGIEFSPSETTSSILAIDRLDNWYKPLEIKSSEFIVSTGSNISVTPRLTITSTGSWRIGSDPGSTGQLGEVLISNGPASPPSWGVPESLASVDVSGGTTGLTTTGGPINKDNPNGTITLSGVLNIANGGTGATTKAIASQNLSNFGQLISYNQYTDFNKVKTWGSTFVKGDTNAPELLDSGKGFYQLTLGAGFEYDWGEEVVNAAQLAIRSDSSNPYLYIRFKDGGTDEANWGQWLKISSGISDSTQSFTGLVTVSNGGTGATNKNDALNNLLPDQENNENKVLITDGANTSWGSLSPNYDAIVTTEGQTIVQTTVSCIPVGSGKAHIMVFLNGVLQMEGIDLAYTITGINQLTFNNPLVAGQNIAIFGFNRG